MPPPLSPSALAYLHTLESRWSTSLPLLLLSSPLRKCTVTSQVLPTSLMFQLKPVSLPSAPSSTSTSSSSRIVLLPSSILPTQNVQRRKGRGIWLTLDARIFTELEKRKVYKALNGKAELVPGMEELVARQLGERVVREAEGLAGRFGGRKRVDLLRVGGGEEEDVEYWVRLQGGKGGRMGGKPVFAPRFADENQGERFSRAIKGLVREEEGGIGGEIKVCGVKQSSVTAPLGIALWRLRMWTRSVSAASEEDGAAREEQQTKKGRKSKP